MSSVYNNLEQPRNHKLEADGLVDWDALDRALHAVGAQMREVRVVNAVRRVNGFEIRSISTHQIREQGGVRSRQSMWLGIAEALRHGFLVGHRPPGKSWELAIAPRYRKSVA